jgi:outer membrane lipoprotein SlyB
MKKLIATVISLIVLSMAALPVAAQTRGRCANTTTYNGRSESRYDSRYDRTVNRDGRYRNDSYRNDGYRNDTYNNDIYSNDNYRYGQNRSVWEQHRDKITTAGGAVGGALLGGLIGGKKGAVIGAITGGAGAAVYTYKIRDKNRRY